MKFIFPVLGIVWLSLVSNSYAQTYIPARKGDRFGFCDSTGHWLIAPQYVFVKPFSEGLAVAEVEQNQYIYINPKGERAFDKIFLEAESFRNGFARVKDAEKGYAWINHTGQYMIHANGSKDQLLLSEGTVVRSNGEDKFGFTDLNGLWLIEPLYNQADPFSDGMAAVELNGKWGFVDRSGTLLVSCAYDQVGPFSEGLAKVCKNGTCGYIDKTGNLKIPLQYDEAGPFTEGLAQVGYGYIEGRTDTSLKRGFIDKSGKVLIPFANCVYNGFSQGIALRLNPDGPNEIIDTKGNVLLRRKSFNLFEFAGNPALAQYQAGELWGFMDRNFNEVIRAQYIYAAPFENGFSCVLLKKYGLYKSDYAYIDPTGKAWVFP